MHFFGYASAPESYPDNATSFVEFEKDRAQNLTDEYYGFRQENEKQIAKVLEISKDPTKVKHYKRTGEKIVMVDKVSALDFGFDTYYSKKFYSK